MGAATREAVLGTIFVIRATFCQKVLAQPSAQSSVFPFSPISSP